MRRSEERVKKNGYLIDGMFLKSMSTGVDRYAFQILRQLDPLASNLNISILVPPGLPNLPNYQNIKVIVAGTDKLWTQGVFAWYARRMHAIPINLCNNISILAPKGIVALHDVCYAESNDFFPEQERKWFLKIYQRIQKRARLVITVSEFSKSRIHSLLAIPLDKIVVIGNAWQHFAEIEENQDVFSRFPEIKRENYILTVSSANKNKNVDWVLENAQHNPTISYVVGGKNLDSKYNFSNYSNVQYVGFLKDEDQKALMRHCRAFLFPSLYEGFGIPPLEAMSVGAEVIVSDIPCLREVCGMSAHYIDPTQPNVDLRKILEEQVDSSQHVLWRYSWKRSAEEFYLVLKENQK